MLVDDFQGQDTEDFFTKLVIRCQYCFKLKLEPRESLEVQWLGLHTFTAGARFNSWLGN